MADYNEFVNKLRKIRSNINFDKMYLRIEKRIAGRSLQTFPKLTLALAGALAVFLIAFMFYFNLFGQPADNSKVMMSYVFEDVEVNGSPVMAYVFGN